MSRVRTLDSLRLLQHDEAGLQSLSSLKHDDFLAAWERGYTKEGWWNDELAAAALKDLRRERLAKKQKRADEQKKRTAGLKKKPATSVKAAVAPAANKCTAARLPAETVPAASAKRTKMAHAAPPAGEKKPAARSKAPAAPAANKRTEASVSAEAVPAASAKRVKWALAEGSTLRGGGDCLNVSAPTLRRREVMPASGAALPDAPCVSFYQGVAHGGSRIAECAWHAWMHPDRGAFADEFVSSAERAAMPKHLGVIITYVDVRGAWYATTVATESATQPGEWGYYCSHRQSGGEDEV